MAKNPSKSTKQVEGAPQAEGTEQAEQAEQAEGAEASTGQSEEAQVTSGAAADTTEQAPEVAASVATSGKTVTVTVPRGFQLRVDDHTVRVIKPGVQEMLEEHATHWYSVANGVTIYNPEA